MSRGALLVGCAVSATFVPALEMVVEALRARNPLASAEQMLDLIFLRGVTGYVDDLNLPRAEAKPEDGV